MKTLHLITIATFMLIFSACKKEAVYNATVIRDCTGTYLRIEGKDYHVCNLEKVSSFENQAKVSAIFEKIKECKGSAAGAIVCDMYHANEGWIEVEKIK